MSRPIKILLVEDQEIIRTGLMLTLSRYDSFRIIGEAANGADAVKQAEALQPDIILLDYGLPVMNGVEAAAVIKSKLPDTRIIMFTSYDSDEDIFAALRAGANGYCLKTVPEEQLVVAINSVASGAAWLDPQIANRVLRSYGEPTSKKSSDSRKSLTGDSLRQKFKLSDTERNMLSYLEKGMSFEDIAERLLLDVETVKNCMAQMLQNMVVVNEGTWPRHQTVANEIKLTPTKGTVISQRYQIQSLIGTGGMGSVYKAKHLFTDRPVALKMLHQHLSNDDNLVKRFQREAQTASLLNHSNIVNVLDFGLAGDSQPYLVMDFISGQSLEDELDEIDYLSIERFFDIFYQVCNGLHAAHHKNIIHRDLKPGNIMMTPSESKQEVVKLIDFGIAKITEDAKIGLTDAGEAVGSAPYMSPEQCRGLKLTPASDLYALGCVMYEALTGKRAILATSNYEYLQKHQTYEPMPFAKVCTRQDIPASLEALVFRLLNKEPAKRFQSALEVQRQLSLAFIHI